MIKKFKSFGQFVCFDLSYKIVREREFRIGTFVGLNQNCSIVPFALVLVNSETKETFKTIFTRFFQLIEGRPEAIVTDDQKAIGSALQELKEE